MKLTSILLSTFVTARNDWQLPPEWAFCPAATVMPGSSRLSGPGGIAGSDRIVGGGPAEQGTWPFIVRLKFGRNFLCGGSLIDGETVVTAAHCCYGQAASDFEVYVNDHFIFDSNDGQTRTGAKSLKFHRDFSWATFKNDVCVLKLKENVGHLINHQYPCLPAADYQFADGSVCYVAGWGLTGETESLSSVLKSVDVELFNDAACQSVQAHAPKEMICGGRIGGGKDACQGDSGGPLICEHDGRVVLAGVTSWGIGCARAGNPGEWAKVSNYIPWIRDHLTAGMSTLSTTVASETLTTTTRKPKPSTTPMPIIDDASELSKPQKQQIRRYCAPVVNNEDDLAKFSLINSGMKNKSKQDQWLMQSTDCMLTRAAKKLQKGEEDGLDAAEIARLGELLLASRERMVCLRAAKRKHKFVPCWPACENLIEDLKANTPNFPFTKRDRKMILQWAKQCRKKVNAELGKVPQKE